MRGAVASPKSGGAASHLPHAPDVARGAEELFHAPAQNDAKRAGPEPRNPRMMGGALHALERGPAQGGRGAGSFAAPSEAALEAPPRLVLSSDTSRRVDRAAGDRAAQGSGEQAPPRPLAGCDAAMTRYAAGEEAAFAIVYDELAPRIYGYLVRQVRDSARAEDILQQTFFQIHRARGTFVPGAEVLPWAFAIARRLMIDGFRRGRREVLGDGDGHDERPALDPAADDLVQAQELATRIQRELARLPETQRAAFELVKQEGLSLAEAAQVLGTTVAAVKLRAHRAYEALRAVLGDVLAERTGARGERDENVKSGKEGAP
jgi:RNA polymerase sigma-70 factor (ECF subfamily)